MAKRFRNGLYIFTQDLRVHDNPGLQRAMRECEHLALVYVFDTAALNSNKFHFDLLGEHRKVFIQQALTDLSNHLALAQLSLTVLQGPAVALVERIIQLHGIEVVYQARGHDQQQQLLWVSLQERVSQQATCANFCQNRLFNDVQLPFELHDLPSSFSQFRKQVQHLAVLPDIETEFYNAPENIELAATLPDFVVRTESLPALSFGQMIGGAGAGNQQLSDYMSRHLPSTYKQTRNELDGWSNSAKLSSWLATGCLSVRAVWHELLSYENKVEKNSSTEWLFLELLWREYFHLYATVHGNKLFEFKGIKNKAPLLTFYPQRFALWETGCTPYPIVNACMRQLNQTGYMSNRGRQLVASCFVHELGLDWRYGAAYFQRQLIDYDPAVNWGNWQYLAGVGADPRGWRQFNLEKQTQQYDPEGLFIERWGGNTHLCSIDAVDMVDWPLD